MTLTLEQLITRGQHLAASPADSGTVEMIVVRTDDGIRETPSSVALTSDTGVDRDHWSQGPYAGMSEMQVSLMNSHVLDLVADGDRDRWQLAGDNLIVDFDLSVDNLPPGTRLSVGSAVLEISAKPHRGCAKFETRFGPDARVYVNRGDGKQRRFRGVYASVIEPGTVDVGAAIEKV